MVKENLRGTYSTWDSSVCCFPVCTRVCLASTSSFVANLHKTCHRNIDHQKLENQADKINWTGFVMWVRPRRGLAWWMSEDDRFSVAKHIFSRQTWPKPPCVLVPWPGVGWYQCSRSLGRQKDQLRQACNKPMEVRQELLGFTQPLNPLLQPAGTRAASWAHQRSSGLALHSMGNELGGNTTSQPLRATRTWQCSNGTKCQKVQSQLSVHKSVVFCFNIVWISVKFNLNIDFSWVSTSFFGLK